MHHPFQLQQFEVGPVPQPPFLKPALWFVFSGASLLVRRSSALAGAEALQPSANADLERSETPSVLLPQAIDLSELAAIVGKLARPTGVSSEPIFLGYLFQQPCYSFLSTPTVSTSADYEFYPLRRLYGALPDAEFALAGRALQILRWSENHQFCSRCATPLPLSAYPKARRCPQCSLRHGPRLSPAVIVRVTRGEKILLARSPRFRPGMYSVLAGFVEPGESLEDTVEREVQEEVGVSLKNIRYFGSQPWPFPDSLMLAFTADYASGTLRPEPGEIEDVAWFARDRLPPVPGPLSIARRLIDGWLDEQSEQDHS